MSNDIIVKNGFNVYPVDKIYLGLNKPAPYVFVFNSDLHTGQGIHYYVVYHYKDNCLFIIDSLGSRSHSGRPYDRIMNNMINEYSVKWYPYRFQQNNSVHCGWFSVFVCNLIRKLNYPDYSVIQNELIKVFGKSADDNDERVLINSFGVKGLHIS